METVSFVGFTKEDIEQSIPSRFEQIARQHPQRLAAKDRQRAIHYEALNASANRIAHAIIACDGARNEAALILLEQSAALLPAILGVLKAGCFYVPLDTTFPEARLRSTIEDCEARVVVTNQRNLVLATRLAGNTCRVVDIDSLTTGFTENLGLTLRPDSLAYIYYTSGSTGKPKGVMDTHRNVLHNVMRYTNHLRIAPSDRLTLLQTPSFSGAVSSMFCAVLNGAASFPFDLRVEGPAALAAWLREERITMYHSVPMIFRSFLTGDDTFPDVRVVRLEGDAASKTDVELFKKHFVPSCILANGLGATETGLSCQYRMTHDTELVGGIVPIGFPTTDMEVLLLDESADGIGEIAVRSEFLAPGYWKQPEPTAKAFVDAGNGKRTYRTGDMGRRRADGCLEYLGRKDFQLKVRGNRVEPAEVESALLGLDNVKEAVVTTRADARGEAHLVAYVVAVRPPGPPASDLRRALASRLPAYMVPTVFVFLDSLPLNENRKVDRRALPEPGVATVERTGARVPARNDIERELLAIWEAELSARPLGVTDNFFGAGGDSLAAMRMLAAVEKRFGRTLALHSLAEAMTIEQLALLLRAHEREADRSTLVPIQPRGHKPPLFCVHDQNGEVFRFASLARCLGIDQPLYGLRSVGLAPGETPQPTIEAMASRYLADIRTVQSRGPWNLCGFCYGAVVVFEMARLLRSQNEPVGLLALLSVSPHDFAALMTPASRRRYRHYQQPGGVISRVVFGLRELRGLPVSQWHEHVWSKARSVPKFVSQKLRRPAAKPDGNAGSIAFPPVTEANRRAFEAYVPRASTERIALFLDQNAAELYTPDAAADYRGLTTGGLRVHIIPGDEHAMMREPGVHQLADQLRGYLG